nr:restriction endonuclease subunit S [Bacteroidales bacterium]
YSYIYLSTYSLLTFISCVPSAPLTNSKSTYLKVQLIKVNKEYVLKYIYEYLCSINIENSGKYERHFKYLKDTKIPLPLREIQKKIVSECEKIDEEYENSHKKVDEYKNAISDLLQTLDGDNRKLKDIAPYSSSRVQYSQINPDSYVTTDNLLQNCEGMKPYDATPNIDSVVRYQQGDILVSNIRPYLKKIWYADREGGCSPDILVFRPIKDINSRFVYYAMKQDSFFDYMMQGTKGMKMPRGDKNAIPNYSIIVPENQETIVSQIEQYEAQIAEAKAIMSGCADRKKKILEKYLN